MADNFHVFTFRKGIYSGEVTGARIGVKTGSIQFDYSYEYEGETWSGSCEAHRQTGTAYLAQWNEKKPRGAKLYGEAVMHRADMDGRVILTGEWDTGQRWTVDMGA